VDHELVVLPPLELQLVGHELALTIGGSRLDADLNRFRPAAFAAEGKDIAIKHPARTSAPGRGSPIGAKWHMTTSLSMDSLPQAGSVPASYQRSGASAQKLGKLRPPST
jgi:hypothetical protein